MKKFINCIIILMLVVFPTKVLAEGYISASPSSLTLEQGSTKTFTITAYNAIGDTLIKSENNSIATVDINEWETGVIGEKETAKKVITVTGKSVGTTKIVINVDGATFDSEDLSGKTMTITVKVVEKPPQIILSNNNNLKSLTVDGYELTKIDNNNYTLNVNNDIQKIKVDAISEDTKAKVTGVGNKDLKVGENIFEIIVTAEDGTQNKVYVKVNRKDGYYLEDLESLLKKPNTKELDIIIKENSVISKENIIKIKQSNKKVNLNYFNQDKKLLYTWSIDGNKIKDSIEIITSISYSSEKEKDIYKLSNYADGLYINFKHNGKLPEGTIIKLYVGDKYENNDVVSIHRYNETENTLEFIKDNLNVIDGYIEFEITHCSNYFVTMSKISDNNKIVNNNSNNYSSINIFKITTIVQVIIIIGLVLIYILKMKKNKKIDTKIETTNNVENTNNIILYNTPSDNVNINTIENDEHNYSDKIAVNETINNEFNILNNESNNINKININGNINNDNINFNTLNNEYNNLSKINTPEIINPEKVDLNTLVDMSNKE